MSDIIEDEASWGDRIESTIKKNNARNRPTPSQTINSNFGTTGPQTRAGGTAQGTSAETPVTHLLSGNKITLVSTSVLVDGGGPGTYHLNEIDGVIKEGTKVTIKPKHGQTLIIDAGVNINVSASVTVTDGQFIILEYYLDSGSGLFNVQIAGSVSGFANVFLSNLSAPTAIDQDLLPDLDITRQLGSQSKRWLQTFTEVIKWVAGREIDLKTVADNGIYYFVNAGEKHSFQINGIEKFSIGAAGLITQTDSTDQLVCQGTVNFNQHVNLGNISTNRISFFGEINTDMIPTSDLARVLGSQSLRWLELFVEVLKYTTGREIDLNVLSFSGILYSVNNGEKHSFQVLGTEELSVQGGFVAVAHELVVSGLSSLNANVIIGNSSANRLTVNAEINSDLLPDADNSRHLGSSSLRWIVNGISYRAIQKAGGIPSVSELPVGYFTVSKNTNLGSGSGIHLYYMDTGNNLVQLV